MNVKRLRQSQKIRVIINDVCFYATAKQIRWGVGDLARCNAAVQKALDALEYTRSGAGSADKCATGLCGTWEGMQVQLTLS